MPLKYQYTKSAGCIKTPNNQVPVLYSLSSYVGKVGTTMWISVNGSNFRDYSQILFSTQPNITPTFYSSSLLTFKIPSTAAGTYSVMVSNGTNISPSTALTFTLSS